MAVASDVGLGSRLATASARPHTPTHILDTSARRGERPSRTPNSHSTRARTASGPSSTSTRPLRLRSSERLRRLDTMAEHDAASARERLPDPMDGAGSFALDADEDARAIVLDVRFPILPRPPPVVRARLVARGEQAKTPPPTIPPPPTPPRRRFPSRTRIPRPRRRRGAIAAAAVSSPSPLARRAGGGANPTAEPPHLAGTTRRPRPRRRRRGRRQLASGASSRTRRRTRDREDVHGTRHQTSDVFRGGGASSRERTRGDRRGRR